MDGWFDKLLNLDLDPALAAGAFALSLLLVVVGVLAVPLVIARMPADYFVRSRGHGRASQRRPFLHAARVVAQNLLGGVLLLAGIAMLVLPGQGVLTILAALSLLSFPGKRRLLRRLLRTRALSRLVRVIRERAGQPPLQLS